MDQRPVLVLDFGAQYAQLIARRVREVGRFSEIVPGSASAGEISARNPAALVLSGGPASVYASDAPSLDPKIFELGVPVFGICYGFQAMAQALGGDVAQTGSREYGATGLEVAAIDSRLFAELPEEQQVWMSHGDAVERAPAGFRVIGRTPGAPVAAFEDVDRQLAGVQFHPEVVHTQHGQQILRTFLLDIAGLEPNWSTAGIIQTQIQGIARQVGEGQAICGLSGGVDSAVAAAMVQRAIGDRLTCVFVDHGLLRAGEREQVERDFVAATGVRLVTVDAADRFLSALSGVSDPEEKRKIIGREFIRVFEAAEADLIAESDERGDSIGFLVQGTLYPDVVESGGGSGTANIKSHHNVGGLPEDLEFALIEPLRTLFKDEVREVGEQLGLPGEMVWRHPFPGPGLAIRIVGAVDAERLEILRAADAIVREELTAAGLDRTIWQLPVVLLADVRSVGVQGDGRSYGHPIVLRPVTSEDAMTADWARLPNELLARVSSRITNEVPEINRVVLDITSKPPGTIEWE
ncbi:MAG: glutamine-hydrolyzing GMP synthase [Micrococcales bacterium]|nr:glutamine-hydrolyzing GMP synthase [Micrococcales bacterium]